MHFLRPVRQMYPLQLRQLHQQIDPAHLPQIILLHLRQAFQPHNPLRHHRLRRLVCQVYPPCPRRLHQLSQRDHQHRRFGHYKRKRSGKEAMMQTLVRTMISFVTLYWELLVLLLLWRLVSFRTGRTRDANLKYLIGGKDRRLGEEVVVIDCQGEEALVTTIMSLQTIPTVSQKNLNQIKAVVWKLALPVQNQLNEITVEIISC